MFLLLVALPGLSQQQTAQLTGSITDSSGAAVPDATVSVVNASHGTKTVVKSDERGNYTVPLLPPADGYTLTVSRAGFKGNVRNNLTLQVAQVATIDVTLDIGDVSETVTVTGAAPLLDAQTSSLGQVITGQTVESLPLNGRSSFRLIALTPGVTFSQSAYGQFGDVAVNSTWDTNFSINGGRAQSNEILIDGVPSSTGFFNQITTLPTVDDTQEFKVQSNNLSAEYGRYSGGAINVTTKSGTNDYHGNVFEFLRNSAFDANDFFNKAAGKAIPPFKMNQFGGTFGGPLNIPKLYHARDRTFFFVDYQGTRRVKGSTFIGTVPTVQQKNGDFSQTFNTSGALVKVFNPFSTAGGQRTQFAGNVIPQGLIDPVAQKILSYYPDPNLPGDAQTHVNNFISNAPVRLSQNLGSLRIDQNVTNKYHLFGRYAYSKTSLTQPNNFGNIADSIGAVGTTLFRNQSFAFDNTYAFSPSLLLTVNYGFARWYQARQTLSYGFDNATLGFPASLVSQIGIPMFPAINIQGYTGLANQSFLNNGNDSHALLISLTKIIGRHNIIVGVDGRMHRINFFNVANSGGTYSFTVAQTQGPTATATSNAAGNAFASFLLGTGNSGSIPLGSGVEMQNLYGAVYVQDNIRLSERLTLNLGLRYDGESPYVDRHNELNYFDTNISSPAANPSFPDLAGGLVFAGQDGTPRNVYTRQHNNVGPRVGFSYSATSETVVRGGFGISYAPLEVANNAVGFSPSLGYASSTSWNTSNNGGLNPANLLSDPYPQGLVKPSGSSLGASTQLGQSISVWNRNPPTPSAIQWNLDVQQQFPAAVLFDLGYSGSRGLHLAGTFERNQLDPKYLSLGNDLTTQVANPFKGIIPIGALSNPTVARRQLLLPYPQFLSVTEVNNPYGESTYHSLQMKIVKRPAHGVSFLAAYTWSKLISNANSQDAPIGPTDNTTVQNYYDLRAERSVSEFDMPQSLVVNTVAELPFGQEKRWLGTVGSAANKIVGGWKVSAILTEQSGFPLILNTSVVGGGNRVNLVPGVDPVIHGSRSNVDRVKEWFNIDAFATPPAYTYGTVRRTFTQVRGPGVQNVDASLLKETSFFDKINTEFRAEFFNVANTPHFGMPNMGRQNAGFGTITGVVASPPPRQIQFALKVSF
ncbi:MAG TPA: TonB-dependent receptor [Edaphobacter sp.]|nr:TonB-dependent receptor [Edaphobacter sp.]